jgi:hypothetical protein
MMAENIFYELGFVNLNLALLKPPTDRKMFRGGQTTRQILRKWGAQA